MLLLHLPFQFAEKSSLEDSVDTGIEAEGLRLATPRQLSVATDCPLTLANASGDRSMRASHSNRSFINESVDWNITCLLP